MQDKHLILSLFASFIVDVQMSILASRSFLQVGPKAFDVTSVVFFIILDIPCSSYSFSIPDLETAISPRAFGSFYWGMIFRTKIKAFVVLTTTGKLTVSPGLFSGES